MTKDEFWDHIRSSRRIDQEEHADRLAKVPEKKSSGSSNGGKRPAPNAYRWNL
jgi:hypothetical protein